MRGLSVARWCPGLESLVKPDQICRIYMCAYGCLIMILGYTWGVLKMGDPQQSAKITAGHRLAPSGLKQQVLRPGDRARKAPTNNGVEAQAAPCSKQ